MDSINSKNWKLWWHSMHPETAPDWCQRGPWHHNFLCLVGSYLTSRCKTSRQRSAMSWKDLASSLSVCMICSDIGGRSMFTWLSCAGDSTGRRGETTSHHFIRHIRFPWNVYYLFILLFWLLWQHWVILEAVTLVLKLNIWGWDRGRLCASLIHK